MIELNQDNYFSPEANWDYMSVSQFKSFLECESKAMAELRGEYKRPKSDAMLEGSYVDAWCEGTLEEFKEKYAKDIYAYGKPEKGLKAPFKEAEEIIKVISKDPLLMEYLEGQKQTILVADMYGATWKAKLDAYLPDVRISDMKIMKSITDKFWSKRDKKYLNFVQHYKYHFQLVAYAMIEAIATKREFYLPTALVVVTKEDPPRKAILEGFEEDFMEVQHYLSYYTPHFMQVKTGEIDADACGECDYCLSTMGTIKQDYHYLTI